jgi:hypothetical protein
MKRALLLIVAPALLVALGFAQTPAASVNTDQTIKGCLAGSDGNYTVVEDGTGHIFKISAASVDFKQHLGHDVTLIGHKASGASSAAVDNSFVVTELNMISEHCAVAAAAPIATVTTPADQHTCCGRHYTHRHFQELVLLALDCGCRAGYRHWRTVPFLQQVEKTEEFGADGRPKSFFYPRSELRSEQE